MTEPTDNQLDQALQRARDTKPSGLGVTKATLILGGALLAGAGFLGGYLVGDHSLGSDSPGDFSMRGNGPGGGPGGGGPGMTRPANLTIGTIESISGTTLTVKTDSGDTVKVKIGDATTVRINKEGSAADLTKGDNVVVDGQRDGDTVTADNVSSGMMMRRGPGRPGDANPSDASDG